jgi:hypothetical protein
MYLRPLTIPLRAGTHALLELFVLVHDDGGCPFDEFVISLGEREQIELAARLESVAVAGWVWMRSQSRQVRPNLFELRRPAEIRVLWTRQGQNKLVLLGGFKKNIGRKQQTGAIEKVYRAVRNLAGGT